MKHYTVDDLVEIVTRRQQEMLKQGITSPEQLGWGDTVLNIASAIILVINDMQGRTKNPENVAKAASTLFHPSTVEELIRLSEILNATEGFPSKDELHVSETQDHSGDITDAMSADELRRLMN